MPHNFSQRPPSPIIRSHLLRPPAPTTNCFPCPPSYSMINTSELHSSTISPYRSIATPPPPCLHPTHKMKTTAPLPASKQAEEAPDSTARSSVSASRTAETLLRVAPMGFCLAALILTVKNSEDNDFGSISYSDLGSFKYLVYMNGLCAGYSIFSALYTAMPRPVSMSRAWTLFFLDQVVTYAILAAGAAAAEIVYLAYVGDEDVTWSRACGVFGGFCRKATASVGITFGAVVCYILLSLISSYRLFSAYHAPISTFAGAVDDKEAH